MQNRFLHIRPELSLIVLICLLAARPVYSIDPGSRETINIGIMIRDDSHRPAVDAARLAIDLYNARGGHDGITFELVVKSVDGPWGIGSNQAVDLVYEDEVVAIIGSLDGRNAHLVEQVATKARILFLSTWATDPTLSQAYVPWYFRIIPNADQQAAQLFDAVYDEGSEKIAFYSQDSYDAKTAAKSFLRKCALGGKGSPPGCNKKEDPAALVGMIKEKGIEKLVLFGDSDFSMEIYSTFEDQDIKCDIYAGVDFFSGEGGKPPVLSDFDRLVYLGSGFPDRPEGKQFTEEFTKEFGYPPGEMAAYSYDGATLILEAILHAGTEREKIQKYLNSVHLSGSLTGDIRFDELGNRVIIQ